MAITITNTPGKTWANGETITIAKLNQTAAPTSTATGTMDYSEITVGAIRADKARAGAFHYATTAGSGSAYTLDLGASIRPDALTDGTEIWAKIHTASLKDATLNVTGDSGSGLGAKRIQKYHNVNLADSDLPINSIVGFRYNTSGDSGSGAWHVVTVVPVAIPAVVADARNIIVKNNTATPDTKIDIDADAVMLLDTNNHPYVARSVDVTIDATTAGANGMDVSNLATLGAGWYYCYVIFNGSTVAGLMSQSSTAPTMPSGYTFKAMVAAVRATSGTVIRRFYQTGRKCSMAYTEVFDATTVAGAGAWEVLAGAALTAFRAAVPPVATEVSGVFSQTGTQNLRVAVSACTDSGAFEGVAANQVGVTIINIPAAASAWNFQGNDYGASAGFIVPVRGGAGNYNIQWTASSATPQHRLEVTGYTI